jgi:two-component system, cell cycle response regulator
VSSGLKILLVDDEVENLKALERSLRGKFEVITSASPDEALKLASENDFAAVLSDQRMPGMLGTELLSQIAKVSPLTTRVILTAYTETQEILSAINQAEIYRYITKPWNNEELLSVVIQCVERYQLLSQNKRLVSELTAVNQNLEKLVAQRTTELKFANEKLSELAMTDPLTKIWNRRAFFARLNEEIERSKRYRHTIVVAMIDVDHFKHFNDMEGHPCGDEALRKVAQVLLSNLRKTDALGRYGGEEFIVLMPETGAQAGQDICERLRTSVEQETFQGTKAPAYLTVSIGFACFPDQASTGDDLIKGADQALYQAKQIGRNRVVHQGSTNESFFVR